MGRIRSLVLPALVLAASFGPAAAPPAVPRTDALGDPLPRGARARLGTVRLRHGHTVSALAFFRDGKTLASAAHDHTVRLWDVQTGKQVRAFGADRARANVYSSARWVNCLALSSDGKSVASGDTRHVTIWDATTGKLLHRFQAPGGVVSLSFSPDGKSLASAGHTPIVHVWDPDTGRPRYQFAGHQPATTWVLFSPDGKTLATGGTDGVVRLGDAATGKEIRRLTGHTRAISALAFSADGKRLASGGFDGAVHLWEAATGKQVGGPVRHRSGVAGVGFTPDGKTVVSAGLNNGQVLRNAGTALRPGAWASASLGNGRILLRDTGTGKTRALPLPPGSLDAVALSPDGKTLALGGWRDTVQLWDLEARRERSRRVGHQGTVHFLAFSAEGRRLTSAGEDGAFCLWDSATGQELGRVEADGSKGLPFALSASSRVAATRVPGKAVSLWGPQTGKLLRRLKGSEDTGWGCALSADGRTVATARKDGTIQLWEVSTGRRLRELKGHQGGVDGLAFAPEGQALASTRADGSLRWWDVGTGTGRVLASARGWRYLRLTFSADGRALAVGGTNGFVQVWETASGKMVRQFSGHQGYVMSLAFAPDGRSLAVGDWMGVRLWDLASGISRGEALGQRGDVTALAFSPSGRVLASAGSDTTVLLWDVARAFPARPRAVVRLTARELDARWADLAGEATRAYQATWDLAAVPAQSVALLAKHLEPVQPADADRLKKLIADLGEDDFDVRKRAMLQLRALGEVAEAALRKAVARATEVDLRLRLHVLLDELKSPTPVRLRQLRAVQVLELAATPEAEKLLRKLAKGAPEARLSREARTGLARLTRR
jgi:WD40 repeat protein